jgi:hypothetical protein
LIIGGLAVAAYGHGRTTMDADFMIPGVALPQWEALLQKSGYEKFHEHAAFAQFNTPRKDVWPVDLLLVNDATFSQMLDAAQTVKIADTSAKVPSPLHLIALKLHALRFGKPDRQAQDFRDIVEIVRLQNVDTSSEKFRATCDKYGSLEVYERIRQAL